MPEHNGNEQPSVTGFHGAEGFFKALEHANRIAATENYEKFLGDMLELLHELCAAKSGLLFLYQPTTHQLIFKTSVGKIETPLLTRLSLNSSGIMQLCKGGKIYWSADAADTPMWQPLYPNQPEEPPHNVLLIPLRHAEKQLGIVAFFNLSQPPNIAWLHLLTQRLVSELYKLSLLEASYQRSERLSALIAIIGQIGSTLDRDHILRMIIDYARELLNAEASSLFLLDEKTGDLILLLASNLNAVSVEQLRIPAGKGIIGHVVATGETVLVADTSQDERHYSGIDQSSGFVTRSILAVPMRTHTIVLGSERGATDERIIGGLEGINKLDGTFDQEDVQLLTILASQAATVLQIANLYADANELFLDVTKALTAAIDAKDPYTEGHSQRVCDFSVEIAREMDLHPEMIHHIRIGSLLHDVGKIGVPDAILTKPGRLTDEEFSIMKMHPSIGERIMSQVRMLHTELPAISEHHERLDGRGYPKGLTGEQISLAGRIVATADVFDAMTSDRPYRGALSVEEVFDFMRNQVGNHFDETCVDALVRAYLKGRIKTQKEREYLQNHQNTLTDEL
ncbi:MAG: GAF domain-containing protein [Anaerolineales bacterium]